VLTVKVKVILACFGHASIKTCLKMNRERSEKREKKKSVGGIQIISPRPLGGAITEYK